MPFNGSMAEAAEHRGEADRWPAGRDATLPPWLTGAHAERPGFDSVVIRGAGVGAMVMAARLARSDAFAGRVRIAAQRPAESPRLVNGCTLRARTLDYAAAAAGLTYGELRDALFGDRLASAETHAQYFALAHEQGTGFALRPLRRWMQGRVDRPLSYGLRNGHLVGRLADRATALGVTFSSESATGFDACRDLADGEHPLVVNAAHGPLDGAPRPPAPERFVVASQVTLRRREGAPLPAQASFIGMRRREGAFDTGVYYPFHDPLTPEADAYGIFYRIVRRDRFDRDVELEAMRETVDGVADALGLDLVEPEATRGEAVVPCLPWSDVPTHRPDYMDLFRTYSACVPIITGDGMTRAALAGWLAAEAVLSGEDPVPATNRALRLWRTTNRGFSLAMTTLSAPLAPVLSWRPEAVLGRIAALPDMWASAA